jgi:benzoyl-CoA reductase/2-hydroxyglutaryl-CoA dehydratase subunit BcrC/BadD/HgdB
MGCENMHDVAHPMSSALERLCTHYRQPDLAARAWKARGGTVVGYLCDNVPEELILAAGFFPLRVRGDPCGGVEAVRRYVDGLFQPTGRVKFAESMLNRLLDGTYSLLDYLIVPHNRDAIQMIYQELTRAAAAFPELRLPELYFLDKSWLPFYASEVFNRDRLLDLLRKLEQWAGRSITDDDLRAAIEIVNEHRALLTDVAALRAAEPSRLSGVEALQIIGSAAFVSKSEYCALLRGFLAEVDLLPPRNEPRVFVGGSPLDHPQLYELIESCGATVVGEDHCWGNRASELPVRTDLAPLHALASRFHQKSACSISYPLERTVQACLERAVNARSEAAIFFVLRDEVAHVWETPDQMQALAAQGIPALHLTEQSYWIEDVAGVRAQISRFLEPLRSSTRRVSEL